MGLGKSFSVGAPKLQTAFLKYEVDPQFTRESVPLLAGSVAARSIEIGTPLGLAASGAPQLVIGDGNVGNGILTLANPALGAGVVPGIYRIICVGEDEDGGEFEVFDPAGISIGTVDVGDPFNDVVKFTIADGATDFEEGDLFEIHVPKGTKAREWDPEAIDGSQVFFGFAINRASAPVGQDSHVLVLETGPAIVLEDEIVWPVDLPAEARATLIAAARAKGIKVRRG